MIYIFGTYCHFRSYRVLLGVHDYSKTKEIQSIDVEIAFPHKDYNPSNHINDVMILKVRSSSLLLICVLMSIFVIFSFGLSFCLNALLINPIDIYTF